MSEFTNYDSHVNDWQRLEIRSNSSLLSMMQGLEEDEFPETAAVRGIAAFLVHSWGHSAREWDEILLGDQDNIDEFHQALDQVRGRPQNYEMRTWQKASMEHSFIGKNQRMLDLFQEAGWISSTKVWRYLHVESVYDTDDTSIRFKFEDVDGGNRYVYIATDEMDSADITVRDYAGGREQVEVNPTEKVSTLIERIDQVGELNAMFDEADSITSIMDNSQIQYVLESYLVIAWFDKDKVVD